MQEPFTILHTSDLHLGLSLHDFNCIERQEDMMRQIVRAVSETHPHAVLVSGDVYNTSQPSVRAERLLAEGVAAMRRAGGPEMRIVITAGNHDSSSRHEAFRELWDFAGVDMVGTVSRVEPVAGPEALAEANRRLVVEVPGCGFILAVPYVHPRNMPEGLWPAMLAYISGRNREGLPVVAMAHTSVGNAQYFKDVTDEENPDSVGGIDVVRLEDFGEGFDYLALGHIHHPATFRIAGGPAVARYCGTPMGVSFDERFAHSLSIVRISGHGEDAGVEISTVPMDDPCPLVNIPARGFARWEECMAALVALPAGKKCLLRLNVLVDGFLHAGAREEALRALEGKEAILCAINSRDAGADRESGEAGMGFSVAEFKDVDPFSLACRYAGDIGCDFTPELQALFREIYSSIDDQ